jgi:hypothetical protein
VAKGSRTGSGTCPFNPAGPGQPLQEGEADTDVHASNGNPNAPDEGNSIATGTGVVVANEGMDELAGNPNFTRPDGSHVVIDAPDYTANDSNDEYYGDASSIAAQGTVTYQYSGALPNATDPIPADCTFDIKGDAPGASLIDLSNTPYDPSVQSLAQVVSGVDNAVSQGADVISESFGIPYVPGSPEATYFYSVNDAAVASGVTVVASAGDNGLSGTVNAPASDPNVIAAAAVDNFRLVAMDDGQAGRPVRPGLFRHRGGLRGRLGRMPAGLPDRVDARHERVGAADLRRRGRRDPGLPGLSQRRQSDPGAGQGHPDQHRDRHRLARRRAGFRAAQRLRRCQRRAGDAGHDAERRQRLREPGRHAVAA